MARDQEPISARGSTGCRGRRGALPAALMAAGLILSACATAGTTAGAPEEEKAPAQAAPAAQAADKPAADQSPEAAPARAAKTAEGLPPGARPWAGWFSPLATVGYIPLKMIPCSLGALGSAVGFLFTFDTKMVQDTLTLSCGGDWVITPGMLEGRDPFRSVGRVETLPGAPAAPSALPPVVPPDVAPPIREPGTE